MEAMNKIEKWHDEGLVEILKTDVMDTEFLDAPPKFRRKSQEYREDIGVFVVGHSRAGHMIIGEGHTHEEMLKLMFPQYRNVNEKEKRKAFRDVMHLATHHTHKRDFFVSEDEHFIRKRDELKKRFGVTILTPKECVEELEPLVVE